MNLKKPIVIACVLLAGCSLIVPKKADDEYVLKTTNTAPAAICANHASVQFVDPEPMPGLESDRIAVFNTPDHINYYTGAKWVTYAPAMIQSFFIRAFDKSQNFKSTGTDLENLSSDITILLTINNFEVRNAQSPTVKINIMAKVLSTKTRKVLEVIPMEKTVTPTANHMPTIVGAFNSGMNDMASQLILAISTGPACDLLPESKRRH